MDPSSPQCSLFSQDPLTPLENLEIERDRLQAALAEAGLLLTEARWACESRGASCDLTAIPTQPGSLQPLIHLHSDITNANTMGQPSREIHSLEKEVGSSSSLPSPQLFTLLAQPGFQLGQQGRGKTAKGTTSRAGDRSATAKREGETEQGRRAGSEKPSKAEEPKSSSVDAVTGSEADRLPEDPVTLICMPPPRELLRCRDQYRCVLEAIVETVNAQHRLLQCLDPK